jgi:hypothetical protein
MRLSGSTRPIIVGFILASGITLTLPHLAFGAAHSFGGLRRFGAPGIHRQHAFSRPFNRFGFNSFGFSGVGGVVVDEQPAITIQQFQPAATTDPMEPVNRIYVQPRWVDGGFGVQVLQPGYWAVPKR